MARQLSFPPLITPSTTQQILGGVESVSLDLGLSYASVKIVAKGVELPDGNAIGFDDLRRIVERENSIFFPDDGILRAVAIANDHLYKLVPTTRAPTVEVDGIRMHRTKGTTPDVDAMEKIKTMGIREGSILDTCSGLGYTAQAALERGAELVVSVELRPEIVRIAKLNPWSRGLFQDEHIHLMLGDAFNILDALPRDFFDGIIHDPPRFATAGSLYSREFYDKMFQVAKGGGRVFHYTGEPGSRHRGVDLRRGVMRRLREAGFIKASYKANVFGVTCEKPL